MFLFPGFLPVFQFLSNFPIYSIVTIHDDDAQEAFTFIKTRRGVTTSSDILFQFYRRAEELNRLDSVLQLSLSLQEEREFVRFLQQSKRADSQEVLLMYLPLYRPLYLYLSSYIYIYIRCC